MTNPAPIAVRECDQQRSFGILMDSICFKTLYISFAEKVLDLMIREGLTLMPDRKAAWISLLFRRGTILENFSVQKVGTTFPSGVFGDGCCFASQEKVARTYNNPILLSSYENRQPEEKKWGGSAKFIFELIPLRGDGSYDNVTVVSAPSGLKEWEDLALNLGIFYRLGLVSWYHPWTQEILHRADESANNDSSSRPKEMNITKYVSEVFEAVGREMKRDND